MDLSEESLRQLLRSAKKGHRKLVAKLGGSMNKKQLAIIEEIDTRKTIIRNLEVALESKIDTTQTRH